MALPNSGIITLEDIQAEFGGPTNPISLQNYYRGGTYVPDAPANSGIPTSGVIGLQDFYGAVAQSLNHAINGESFSVTDTESSPSIAVASVSVRADGQLTFGGNGAPANTTWLIAGDPTAYEVRWDNSTGQPSGAAVETWLGLGVSGRTWTETRNGVGVEAAIGTITIRNKTNTSESISFSINPLLAQVT